VFGPDHPAGLRPGFRYPAWAPAAGAFGASPAQALGRGRAKMDGIQMSRPQVIINTDGSINNEIKTDRT